MTRRPAASVVIPAHDEEARIGATLVALLDGPEQFEVVVVCNGCSDGTATIARDMGVVVAELDRPSKAAALRRGDELAVTFPRIYLDGDVVLSNSGAAALAAALDLSAPAVAGVPAQLDLSRCSRAVRWYYEFRQTLPIFQHGIIGAGVYALNERGRERFDDWPEILGDDHFVFRLFHDDERITVRGHRTEVEAPPNLRSLVARGVRIQRGNREVSAADFDGVHPAPSAGIAAAAAEALKRPRAWPRLLTWAIVGVVIRIRLRVGPTSGGDWEDARGQRPARPRSRAAG